MAEIELLPDIEFMGRQEGVGDIYNISKVLLIQDRLKDQCPKYNLRLTIRCDGLSSAEIKKLVCQRNVGFTEVP